MPRRLVQRPQVEADAYDQIRYLAQHSSEAAARFAADLRTAFDQLIRFPRLGRPWPTRNPELRSLRRLELWNFPLSIFYRRTRNTIEIVRLLHHRRRVPPELEQTRSRPPTRRVRTSHERSHR